MAVPVAELDALRDALIRARASNTREVELGDGRRVKYSSDAEMAAALADLDRRIAAAAQSRPGSIRFRTSKGL